MKCQYFLQEKSDFFSHNSHITPPRRKERSFFEKGLAIYAGSCYNEHRVQTAPPYLYPWHSWIARQTPTLKVVGSNPIG